MALPVQRRASADLRPREEGTIGRRDAADRQSRHHHRTEGAARRRPTRARCPGRERQASSYAALSAPCSWSQLSVCGKVQAQDTGVRLEQEAAQARVLRRRVTFERDGELQRLGRDLDRCHEVEVVLEVRDGWQETKPTRTRFDAQGGARRVIVTRALLGQAALATRAHAGVEIGEASTRFERRALDSGLERAGFVINQAVQRQAIAHGGAARRKIELAATETPGAADPAGAGVIPGKRQDVTGRRAVRARQTLGEGAPAHGIAEILRGGEAGRAGRSGRARAREADPRAPRPRVPDRLPSPPAIDCSEPLPAAADRETWCPARAQSRGARDFSTRACRPRGRSSRAASAGETLLRTTRPCPS